MNVPILLPTPEAVIYPEDDGLPMSENTLQLEYILLIKGNLDALFADDPNVFIAADLLWYPVEGDNTIRQAGDIMAVFGRPKGYRGSYRQWEEGGIGPQVLFEIRSPGNRAGEMRSKFDFYQRYGVDEYYFYDPDRGHLQGWLRQGDQLVEIPVLSGWVSPRLGVRFELVGGTLELYFPDGRPFLSHAALDKQWAQERAAKENERAAKENERAAKENERAAKENERAAKERAQREAEQERLGKEEALQRAEQEKQRADRLLEQLKARGIDPEA